MQVEHQEREELEQSIVRQLEEIERRFGTAALHDTIAKAFELLQRLRLSRESMPTEPQE